MTKVSVQCPNCESRFLVARDNAGKRAKCPKCEQPFLIRIDEGAPARCTEGSSSPEPPPVPSPGPASDRAVGGVRRILRRAVAYIDAGIPQDEPAKKSSDRGSASDDEVEKAATFSKTTLFGLLAIGSLLVTALASSITREMTRELFVGSKEEQAAGGSKQPPEYAAGSGNLLDGTCSFAIGRRTFTVKQPIGYVLLENSTVRAGILHPPDNQLHLVFISEVDAARIMNGDAPALDRYVTIQTNRKLDATAVTPGMFHEVKASMKNEGLEDSIARNKRTVNDFLAETGQHIDEMRTIGFTETQDSYTLTGLVKRRVQGARVNTVTMRNLHDCCVVVATTAVCRTQDDIEWSQSVAAECAASLR